MAFIGVGLESPTYVGGGVGHASGVDVTGVNVGLESPTYVGVVPQSVVEVGFDESSSAAGFGAYLLLE